MAIIRNESLGSVGYFSNNEALTNFIFEILSVEYKDNPYGYFQIKVTNDNSKFVVINNISIVGPLSANFHTRLLEEGFYICYPDLSQEIILDIFSLEFNLFKNLSCNENKEK